MAKEVDYRPVVCADELQVLLKVCIDVGVESVRRQNGRTEPLFYDVQQRMSHYGDFPKRKLYRLQTHYFRTERDFLNGKLDPYPPEARQLWGTAEHDANAPDNDKRWSDLVNQIQQRKQNSSHVTRTEAREIVRLALQRNLEKHASNDQDYVYEKILSELKTKNLFLNRNVTVLKQIYLRLQKQFQKGRARYLLPEAAKLWPSSRLEQVTVETETSHSEDENEPFSGNSRQETSPELPDTVANTENKCRICQARLHEECKDLLQDTYNNQTYGKIIQEIVHVQIPCDGQTNSKICLQCSCFIEKMLLFVQQCREACNINCLIAIKFDEIIVNEKEHDTIEEVDLQTLQTIESTDATMDYDSHEVSSPMQSQSPVDVFRELEDKTGDEKERKIITKEQEYPEIGEKRTEEAVTDEQKYQEFVKSLPAKPGKQQCHLCGKTVDRLAQHLIRHGAAEFQCEICSQKCINKRQLREHMNLHTQKKTYPCRTCERVFYNWTSRKYHEQGHSGKFTCDKCGAVYKTESGLRRHFNHTHKGIRRYACSSCPFKTFVKPVLLNHIRGLHTSERPYLCTFCDSTANSSNSYYTHFQRHKKSGEATEYSMLCAYCGEHFNKNSDLEKHICKKHPDVAVVI
ncbi:zinc finger protein ZFP2-like [Wyeomyia smithii]|uniref:zinc finger protein ZFP2-like n=1 Tax=Wyeomyia smithii TaxID=174621 RepID=UPI002468010D|nr:zinc finger protein ZFP2-like [Wyeomyia smithii]XP_055533583.1 zinc finger protein ZFP2-like [Wyeomyia smithii]XP_055533584.1 zinc finger protein ZFP2-like [Wyeomyia smithii]